MTIISIFQKRLLAYFRIFLLNVYLEELLQWPIFENRIIFLNMPRSHRFTLHRKCVIDLSRLKTCFLSKYVLLSVLRRKSTEFPKQAAAARSIEQYTTDSAFLPHPNSTDTPV